MGSVVVAGGLWNTGSVAASPPLSPALAGEFFTTEPPGKLPSLVLVQINGMHQ